VLAPAPPSRLALEYEHAIRKISREVWKMINADLVPAMDAAQRTDADDPIDVTARVKGTLRRMNARLRELIPVAAIRRTASRVMSATDARHKRSFYRQLSELLGVGVTATEGFREATLRRSVRANAALIKSVRDDAIPALARDVEKAFRSGVRHEVLRKQWRDRGLPLKFGTIEGRSKVIARDQISKLNGQLTRSRQANIGITSYTWRTSGDERVRDAHDSLDGRVFQWDKPPSEGHPGEPVQCRCVAEAVVDTGDIAGSRNLVPTSASGEQALGAAAS
jgi:SPP1 gp7 family putative phage head morphogenesis protein